MDWPDKKIRIQAVPDFHAMEIPCFPNWIKFSAYANELMSDAFKQAADIVVFHHDKDEPVMHPDTLYTPIMYLYRHSIELMLKEFVFQLNAQNLIDSDKAKAALSGHNLHKLWNLVKPVIIANNPKGNPEIPKNAEIILRDLHDADPDGQTFRYATSTNGNVTSDTYPDHVDLKRIHAGVSALHAFLSGCLSQISVQ